MSWLFRFFPLLLLIIVGGCKPYAVLKTSGPPSALVGKQSFEVVADFSAVQMGRKTEAQYLEEKDDEARASWQGDKEGMLGEFVMGLQAGTGGTRTIGPAAAADGQGVDVVVHWDYIEVGAYTVVVNLDTRVNARVEFFVDGVSMDEIQVSATVESTMTTAAAGQRVRMAGRRIGQIAARYLQDVEKEAGN